MGRGAGWRMLRLVSLVPICSKLLPPPPNPIAPSFLAHSHSFRLCCFHKVSTWLSHWRPGSFLSSTFCNEQLFPQPHYDFSLQALKAVLASADVLKCECLQSANSGKDTGGLSDTISE